MPIDWSTHEAWAVQTTTRSSAIAFSPSPLGTKRRTDSSKGRPAKCRSHDAGDSSSTCPEANIACTALWAAVPDVST
eukprot:6421400-Prymnesium_polylepis.2